MKANSCGAFIDINGSGIESTAVSIAPESERALRPIHELKTIDDYLLNFGGTLGKKAIEALTPLHVPERHPLPAFEFGRELFPAQQHVVAAIAKMFNTAGSGFLCGEMGTGKTFMGMAAVQTHAQQSRAKGGRNGKYRAIVLCPDHLVGKWCREIRESIPDSTVVRFGPQGELKVSMKRRGKGEKALIEATNTRRALRDTLALTATGNANVTKTLPGEQPTAARHAVPVSTGPDTFEMLTPAPRATSGQVVQQRSKWRKPQVAEWFVLGRNQAKWLSDWAGMADPRKCFDKQERAGRVCSKAVVVEREPVTDENGRQKYDSEGDPVTKPVTSRVHFCPKCGQIVRDKQGVPVATKELTSGKSVAQKKCKAKMLKSIFSTDRPSVPGGQILSPIPSKFGDKQADTKVKHAGQEWEVIDCGEPLYNYTSKPYRWSPASIIQRKLKGMFNYLLIDEMQEQKSDETAQSMACGKLIGVVDHVLAMTGTIIGGYATHLFPLMIRITPKTLRAEGFEWGGDTDFAKVYGRIRTVVTATEQSTETNVTGRATSMRKAKTGTRSSKPYVDPGVMPTMFAKHMMGTSIFITLEELADNLPDLFEYVGGEIQDQPEELLPGETAEEREWRLDLHKRNQAGWFETVVDMESGQRDEYRRIMAIIEATNRDLVKRGKLSFLGAMLWTGLDYPDRPFGWGHDPDVSKAIKEDPEAQPPSLLGQSFLKHFDYRFEPATETLVLRKDGETDRVKLKKDPRGTYDVYVTFNGNVTKPLVYDTGASSISLSQATANEIGWKPKAGDRNGLSQIADGSTVPTRLSTIDSVTVGKFTISNVECSIKAPKLPHTVGYWDKPGSKKLDNWMGVVTPRDCPEDVVYSKEQTLIDICKQQKKEGRQSWVYVNMTGKRNIQPRLKALLEKEGLKVGVLRSDTVDPIEREAWIEENGRNYDVMISHPELVKTGLDLFTKVQGGHNFSTIIFYETGYNLFTMRQAARRAWRIGQPHDCRVYYLYYRDTMQHKAMQLMSRKMAASQALEGEFSENGLAAMAGEDNLQMALAKRLSDRISEADIKRNWGKVKSAPKKKVSSNLDTLSPEQQAEVVAATAAQLVTDALEGDIAGDDLRLAGEAARLVAYKGEDPCDTLAETPTLRLVTHEDEPEEEDEDDDDFVMPELTPEIMMKMFANMEANNL
jgi:clan AA aspartic protease (TIGR02281 family)